MGSNVHFTHASLDSNTTNISTWKSLIKINAGHHITFVHSSKNVEIFKRSQFQNIIARESSGKIVLDSVLVLLMSVVLAFRACCVSNSIYSISVDDRCTCRMEETCPFLYDENNESN